MIFGDQENLFLKAEKADERGDLRSANQLWLEAARLGHTGAQVIVGNHYSLGRGLPKSLQKAAYWYRRAYKAGDESGALNLAVDKLTAGNARAAIFWLRRAIELRSGEAALELARLYSGKRGGKSKALELLKMTQRMRASEISEQAKKDAAALLATLGRESLQS
jgi:TPR repeat protein